MSFKITPEKHRELFGHTPPKGIFLLYEEYVYPDNTKLITYYRCIGRSNIVSIAVDHNPKHKELCTKPSMKVSLENIKKLSTLG